MTIGGTIGTATAALIRTCGDDREFVVSRNGRRLKDHEMVNATDDPETLFLKHGRGFLLTEHPTTVSIESDGIDEIQIDGETGAKRMALRSRF